MKPLKFPKSIQPLKPAFFARPTLAVARDVIGTLLVHEQPTEKRLVGRIVEAEAYTQDDPAFRSWGVVDAATGLVKPEGRALALFGKPGTAYVYRCYNHWLLNVVTEPEGRAGCVLLRAVAPLAGRQAMWPRREAARRAVDLTNGPGKLTQAFDVDNRFHGQPLTAPPLYLTNDDEARDWPIATSSRIGLHFGIDVPYRFFVKDHPFVSPGVPSDEAAKARRLPGS